MVQYAKQSHSRHRGTRAKGDPQAIHPLREAAAPCYAGQRDGRSRQRVLALTDAGLPLDWLVRNEVEAGPFLNTLDNSPRPGARLHCAGANEKRGPPHQR